MIRFTLKKGLRFLCGQTGWTLNKQLVNGNLQLESDDGELEVISRGALFERWLAKQFYIDQTSLLAGRAEFYFSAPADIATLDEPQQAVLRLKLRFIDCVKQVMGEHGSNLGFRPELLNPKLAEVAASANVPPPSPRTMRRWWGRFAGSGSVMTIRGRRCDSGRRKNETQQAAFREALDEIYLTAQKERASVVVEAVQEKIRRFNHDLEPGEKPVLCPGRSTIFGWFRDLDARIVHAARHGKRSASQEFREAQKTLKCKSILERIEIDHSPLDVFIIDSFTKLPLGRPWLTIAIDRYSRAIVGFYISFRTPSSYSVLMCLRQAMLPKEDILTRFGIKGVWPCFGIPKLIATDNGMDLHSDAVELICAEMGIELLFCGAGKPQHKGAVERVIRTVQEHLIHRLPGTTFHNVDDRGDYPSEEVAAIDMQTLVHLVVKWIVEQYMVKPHRGLHRCTPLRRWQEAAEETVIELPAFQEELEVLIGAPEKRTLFHYGLEVDSLRYNSSALQRLRARVGGSPELSLKVYEHTIAYVDVWDAHAREYLRVGAVDGDYAKNLTRHMHRVIKAHTKATYGEDHSVQQRQDSKAEMQRMILEAKTSKKLADRKKAAALNSHDSHSAIYDEAELDEALSAASTPTPHDIPATLFSEDAPSPDFEVEDNPFIIETCED